MSVVSDTGLAKFYSSASPISQNLGLLVSWDTQPLPVRPPRTQVPKDKATLRLMNDPHSSKHLSWWIMNSRVLVFLKVRSLLFTHLYNKQKTNKSSWVLQRLSRCYTVIAGELGVVFITVYD